MANAKVAFHRLIRSIRQSAEYFVVNEVLDVAFGEAVSVASHLRAVVDQDDELPVERANESSSSESDDGVEIVFAKIKKPPSSRLIRASEPRLQIFPTHKYSLRAQSVLFAALHENGPYQTGHYHHLCKLTKLSRAEISAWFNCKRRLFKMKLTVEAESAASYAKAANEIFLDNYLKGECNCLGKDCFMNLHIKH